LPAADADDAHAVTRDEDAPCVCVADLVAAWVECPTPLCRTELLTEALEANALLLVVTDGVVVPLLVLTALEDVDALDDVDAEPMRELAAVDTTGACADVPRMLAAEDPDEGGAKFDDVDSASPLEITAVHAEAICTDFAQVVPAADADDDRAAACDVDTPCVCVADLVAAWLEWPTPACNKALVM
jgi:hypothetical protein